MARKTRKKGNTGKRYSEAQKKKILAFVRSRGRGGITQATKKFGVSYIALARWMKGKGVKGGKVGRPPKAAPDRRALKRAKKALKAFKALKKQFTMAQRALKAALR